MPGIGRRTLLFAAALAWSSPAAADDLESTRPSATQPAGDPSRGALEAARDNTAGTVTAAPRPRHVNPRFKLSYRGFAISNLDGSPLWLNGAQLDAYFVSRRWFRAGVELEGGAAHADLSGYGASLGYGLAGLTLGVQYPARVTPFLDGRFAAGVLGGRFDGSVNVGTTTVSDASAVTWIYGGGLEAGVEVYTVGRVYVSAAVGWVRTTWHGVDLPAMLANPSGGMQFKDLTGDSFTFKIGLGI